VVIFANTDSHSRLRQALGAEQHRLTSEFAALITEGQRRDWVDPTIDPEAMAGFIQASAASSTTSTPHPQPSTAGTTSSAKSSPTSFANPQPR
jgi:hypothetical protein